MAYAFPHKKETIWVVHGIALLSLIALFFLAPHSVPPRELLIALLCILAAVELVPVSLQRLGFTLTVTLPFLAGLSILGNWVALICAQVGSVLLASIIHRSQAVAILGSAILKNVSIGVICSSVGIFSCLLIFGKVPANAELAAAWGLLFACTHGLSNLLLVRVLTGRKIGTRLTSADVGNVSLSIVGLITLMLFSMGVCVAVYWQDGWLAAGMALPVLLFRFVVAQRARMLDHHYESVMSLMLLLQRAHPYSHGHLQRVAKISEQVALRLGLNAKESKRVFEAAMLHDIGKIAIDEAILDKPARLTEDEFAHVQKHAEFGADILRQSAHFHPIVSWIHAHHERPDGTGYPRKLPDSEIPLGSKIIAVSDAFDAMYGGVAPGSARSYREPLTLEQSIAELHRCSGTQFDPVVVDEFCALLLEANPA